MLFIVKLEVWKLQSALAQDQVPWGEFISEEYLHQSSCKAEENTKGKQQYGSFCMSR